jgi:hypothetical protein
VLDLALCILIALLHSEGRLGELVTQYERISGPEELLVLIDIRQFVVGIKTQCLSSGWSTLIKVWLLSQ